MTDLRVYNLLHKKVSGQLTDSELTELRSFEDDEDFQELRQDIENIWIASKDYYPNRSFNVEAAKAKFKKNMAAELAPTFNPTSISRSQQFISTQPNTAYWLLGASVFGLIILAAYLLWPKDHNTYQEIQTETLENNIEYAMLDDNTEVWLQAGSVLRIGEFIEGGKRNISLRGEAFFDVEHDPERPFVVEMGNDNYVEVLGTSFNIITNTGDESSKVDVKQGSVRVYNANNPDLTTIVTAGEYALINDTNESLEAEHNPVIYSLLGTSLSFRNSDLYTVFDELEKVYDVDINYDKVDCLNSKFTSPLMDNYSIEDAMSIITTNYAGLSYTTLGDMIDISGSACE